ncbi:MAG: long-chain-fatty-acid--CoA ligase [Actinobacteria bacterium]|nr:long-chain-fatty-acid--CoA ligase [Actinomycetota bacterium]
MCERARWVRPTVSAWRAGTATRGGKVDTIRTIADVVRVHGAQRPDAIALTMGTRDLTFRELDRRSNQVAQALRGAGVERGDRVAFIDKNGIEWFEVTFALAKLGAVNVSVNWRLAPVEMAQIIDDAQAEVVIVGPDFVDHIDKIRAELRRVHTIVALAPHERWPVYEQWLSSSSADDPGVESSGDDIAFQLYTSGTTGLPKGVMLTNDNFFAGVTGLAEQWRFTDDSVNLAMMPLFHIAGAGWSMVGLSQGCRTVVLRDVDPTELLRVIPAHGVTNAFMVPAVIQFLLMTPGVESTDFSSLRALVYGASPIADTVLVRAIETFGCELIQVYGLTETTGAITQLDGVDHDPVGKPRLLRSCGKPYPWVEVRIVDATTGDDVPPGEVGELWTRSHQNMPGYWNAPDATAAAITPDRWFRTGDAAYTDEDGYLFLHDRLKDMIVSGGENVYPAEVENVLMTHPDVADVAVIGVPDERWGEAVKAVVVCVGSRVSAEELIAFARERLAGYKLPKSVDFAESLPRNPSGKLLKRQLREPYWAGVQRRIG